MQKKSYSLVQNACFVPGMFTQEVICVSKIQRDMQVKDK